MNIWLNFENILLFPLLPAPESTPHEDKWKRRHHQDIQAGCRPLNGIYRKEICFTALTNTIFVWQRNIKQLYISGHSLFHMSAFCWFSFRVLAVDCSGFDYILTLLGCLTEYFSPNQLLFNSLFLGGGNTFLFACVKYHKTQYSDVNYLQNNWNVQKWKRTKLFHFIYYFKRKQQNFANFQIQMKGIWIKKISAHLKC